MRLGGFGIESGSHMFVRNLGAEGLQMEVAVVIESLLDILR